jgi:uncharacterized membrane protein YgdD (TMEM256/DUF423 family)
MELRKQLLIASLLCAIGVIILAIAAHYLDKVLLENQINAIKTAANIQLLHCIGIFSLINLTNKIDVLQLKKVINLILIGVSFFSGSIYFLSLKTINGLEWLKFIWPITPIGGAILIIAWINLFSIIYKYNK